MVNAIAKQVSAQTAVRLALGLLALTAVAAWTNNPLQDAFAATSTPTPRDQNLELSGKATSLPAVGKSATSTIAPTLRATQSPAEPDNRVVSVVSYDIDLTTLDTSSFGDD